MKLLLLALLSFSLVSCATHREPSSVTNDEETTVDQGINSDFFGTR